MILRQICSIIFSLLVLIVLVNSTNAQSKDRDNPTQLTSGEISGLIDSDTKGSVFYYSFTVNPGEVVITLSVESNPPVNTSGYSFSTKSIIFTLFDRNAEAISNRTASTFYGNGTGQAVGRVIITRRQTVVLGINIPEGVLNEGTGKYRVKVSGSVEFYRKGVDLGEIVKEIKKEEASKNKDCLPKQGTLIIKMKDGSKKIIDLSEAETITLVP